MSGSAAERAARAVLRLRRRWSPPAPPSAVPAAQLELDRAGPVPLVDSSNRIDLGWLRIAIVIPSFRRGGGGMTTIAHLARGLRKRGHAVSIWLEDVERLHAREPSQTTRRTFADFFDARDLELHLDFAEWRGADVAVATSWQTVARVLRLPDCSGRAYLVQDHEPEFYPTSAESLLAADTYRAGLHCIAASPWLAETLRERYGAVASHFDLGIDQSTYSARPKAPRREDLVVFYARAETARRAVPLGLLALGALARRRPALEIALFGSAFPAMADFPHTQLGELSREALAELYRSATVGIAFSLTNPSLVDLEMMACGLPCVDLDTEPVRATFGSVAALVRAAPTSSAVCSTVESLLDDSTHRAHVGHAGPRAMTGRTWAEATLQVERALRDELSVRASL